MIFWRFFPRKEDNRPKEPNWTAFHPAGPFKTFWNMLVAACVLHDLVIIPVKLGRFRNWTQDGSGRWSNSFSVSNAGNFLPLRVWWCFEVCIRPTRECAIESFGVDDPTILASGSFCWWTHWLLSQGHLNFGDQEMRLALFDHMGYLWFRPRDYGLALHLFGPCRKWCLELQIATFVGKILFFFPDVFFLMEFSLAKQLVEVCLVMSVDII